MTTMSSVEEVSILLEHDIDEQYQYQPGEVVEGNVRVKVSRPTAIRGVTLRVVGQGNVSWKDEDSGLSQQAEETYVDASTVVMDTPPLQPHNLPPGCSNFPFRYQLPDNLPSSFIGKFGNVTYTLKASVTGVKAIDAAITSEPFLVMRRSLLPLAATEQSLSLSQAQRFWAGCSFGKVSARLTLEGRGGVPGQDVFMQAEVKNQSSRTLTAMQASLMLVSTYHARNNTIGFSQIVSRKRDEFEVECGEGRRWNYVRLTLPPYIPETHLEHCDIIDIHYVFQFRVEISGGAELVMEAPFLIGSHLPGQEPRRNISASPAVINHQWTTRTEGFHMDQKDSLHIDFGEPQNPWGLDSRVAELQGDRSVVRNPLFRHGSFRAQAGQDSPEEQMENTRL